MPPRHETDGLDRDLFHGRHSEGVLIGARRRVGLLEEEGLLLSEPRYVEEREQGKPDCDEHCRCSDEKAHVETIGARTTVKAFAEKNNYVSNRVVQQIVPEGMRHSGWHVNYA